MNCIACSNEYPAPDIIEGTAYFVCTNCGEVHEVKNYRGYTRDEITAKIEEAFAGVVLGNGVGLFEAQALDDYASEEVQRQRREKDEKLNWQLISSEGLQNCHSSLSFFDAEGMRFHLPAFIIGNIKGEVGDPIYNLTNIEFSLFESRFGALNAIQKKAVSEYLTWCLTENEFEYHYPAIRKALSEYWEK